MKTLTIALLAFAAIFTVGIFGTGALTGCSTVEKTLQNETFQRITAAAAKTLVNYGLNAVAEKNPDYAEAIFAARDTLNLRYNIVFAHAGTDLTIQEVAANVLGELQRTITDPAVYEPLKDQLIAELKASKFGDLVASDTGGGSSNLDALATSLAAALED